MCLILVVWRVHPVYRCVIAANRDEFHQRPTAPARWWTDKPDILGGRDLLANGTWLGLSRSGRFAALTNFRGAASRGPTAPSRGELVTRMLDSRRPLHEELAQLAQVGGRYNGFNLVVSDGEKLGIYESERGVGRELGPGVYGLSNHLLDTPWPKVHRAKSRLMSALGELPRTASILDLLRDDQPAADEDLPRTGVSLEWERLLSSAFVRSADYGTRCSTVVCMRADGATRFEEWSWAADGGESGRQSVQFTAGA